MVISCAAGAAAADGHIDFSGKPEAQRHDTRWYAFQTDSVAGTVWGSDKQTFWVQVRNNSDTELHAVWHIPKFNHWVLPRSVSPPHPRDVEVEAGQTPNVFLSCLSYGNRGHDHVEATLIGTSSEQAESKIEIARGCARLIRLDAPPDPSRIESNGSRESSISEIVREYEIVFPSEIEDPGSTMLAFQANYELRPETESSYAMDLFFDLERVEGYEAGDPRGMTVTLLGAIEDAFVSAAIEENLPDGVVTPRGMQTGLAEGPVVYAEWTGEGPISGQFSFFVEGGTRPRGGWTSSDSPSRPAQGSR